MKDLKSICRELGEDYKSLRKIIETGYKGRAYHNLDHINTVLQEIEDYPSTESTWRTYLKPRVKMAAYFHDIDKDVRKSIELYLAVSSIQDPLVVSLIESTGHPFVPRNEYERVLHDADLAILGYPWPAFKVHFEDKVREEYFDVDDQTYYPERKKILTSLFQPAALDYLSIYSSRHFRRKYHTQSVENLTRLFDCENYQDAERDK